MMKQRAANTFHPSHVIVILILAVVGVTPLACAEAPPPESATAPATIYATALATSPPFGPPTTTPIAALRLPDTAAPAAAPTAASPTPGPTNAAPGVGAAVSPIVLGAVPSPIAATSTPPTSEADASELLPGIEVYNPPSTMTVNQAVEITLRVTTQQAARTPAVATAVVSDLHGSAPPTVTANPRLIGKWITAELKGDQANDFRIVNLYGDTEDRQEFSLPYNEWVWAVTPLRTGTLDLHLAVLAQTPDSDAKPLMVEDKKIDVQVGSETGWVWEQVGPAGGHLLSSIANNLVAAVFGSSALVISIFAALKKDVRSWLRGRAARRKGTKRAVQHRPPSQRSA